MKLQTSVNALQLIDTISPQVIPEKGNIFQLSYVIKTNLMQYLSSVYFVRQPLHVSGIFVTHHLEVNCVYTTTGTCCSF